MSTDKKPDADQEQSADKMRGDSGVVGAKRFRGLHSEITEKILGVFFDVHNELGGGFLEGVYQQALRIALTQAGLQVAAEVPVPVHFRGQVVGNFRADLIVNDSVLLELRRSRRLIENMKVRFCIIFVRLELKWACC
jgi:GxxExxY protein